MLEFGAGSADITPDLGAPMMGQLVAYPNTGVESPLRALAMALREGGCTGLFVVLDLLMMSNQDAEAARQAVAARTGVDPEAVVVSATHTHSGPSTMPVFGQPKNQSYHQKMIDGAVAAAEQAVAGLQPAQVGWAEGRCPGYGFNRRFRMADGSVETHPLKFDPLTVSKEGPDSEAIHLLAAAAVDSPDEWLGSAVFFGCHPTVMPRVNTKISADYPGKVREELEMAGPGRALFFQAASGNICQCNTLEVCRPCELGTEHCRTMGKGIANCALQLRQTLESGPGRLVLGNQTIAVRRRALEPELLRWAEEHQEVEGLETPPLSDYGTERFGSGALSLESFFKSAWWANMYARELRGLQRDFEQQQGVQSFRISVLAYGARWAIVSLPCELFVEHSLAIAHGSPFAHTALNTLANGHCGYLPTREAFERSGGYETKNLSSTYLVPEAGEQVVASCLELLQKLFQEATEGS